MVVAMHGAPLTGIRASPPSLTRFPGLGTAQPENPADRLLARDRPGRNADGA